ncbi:hypothetical protein PUMCH_004205 [Australozyma saopauloensis]|uniref:Cysteine proteinase 1, mitochondrial n=1 Tax=Australozyma saopauloensis TaxID=291208 RepID=A0AAX4HE17_9ASCO|nr:hypothetical protein PUMCH_004205 [[Candida] saopauloensis]
MTDLKLDKLSLWTEHLESDQSTQLAASVLANVNADDALIDRATAIKNSTSVFNTSVKVEGAPVTNQKASGRCWLFASGNVLRLHMMEKLSVKEFQFSQSYWFFHDKLERCNYFLNTFAANMSDEKLNDVESQLNQHLLTDPTCDGGQFDMFINIIEKYGAVPHELYPDAFSATSSRRLNFLILTKLREFAEQLKLNSDSLLPREALVLIQEMQQEIHRLMVLFLGKPPAPNSQLSWDYKDKDDKVHTLKFTPLLLYKDVLGVDVSNWVSLLNDPRNPYDSLIKIDKLGNVVGAKDVSYVNIEVDALAKYAVERIKSNQAVFFGTHTPIYMDKKRGIMDESLYSYNLIGFKSDQSKSSRIKYKQSLMTHAMTLTAVHLDENGNPVRWRVENSWGKDSGQNGYYVMDHQYFKDYVYQIVVDKNDLLEVHKEVLNSTEPIVLPPWDPMGALAIFKNEVDMI